MKLIGNSAHGSNIINKEKHTDFNYCKFAKRGKYLCDRCGLEFDHQPLFQQLKDSDHLNGDSIISSSLFNNNDRANCLNQEEVSFANVPKSDNTDRFHVQTAGRSSNIWNHATKDVSASKQQCQ